TSRLDITSGADGRCHVVFQVQSSVCGETIEKSFVPYAPPFSVDVEGTTACAPAGCRFSEADDPCAVGARRGSHLETHNMVGLNLVTQRSDSQGLCRDWGRTPEVSTWRPL